MPVPDFSPGEILTAQTMDSIGLWKISETSISGSGVIQPTGFSTDFTNYKLLVTVNSASAATAFLYLRLTEGSTPYSQYFGTLTQRGQTGAVTNRDQNSVPYFTISEWTAVAGSSICTVDLDIFRPALSARTLMSGVGTSNANFLVNNCQMGAGSGDARVFSGFEISASTGTLTGVARLYGYRD